MKIKKMTISQAEPILRSIARTRGLRINRVSDLQIVLGIISEREWNVNKFSNPRTK